MLLLQSRLTLTWPDSSSTQKFKLDASGFNWTLNSPYSSVTASPYYAEEVVSMVCALQKTTIE